MTCMIKVIIFVGKAQRLKQAKKEAHDEIDR